MLYTYQIVQRSNESDPIGSSRDNECKLVGGRDRVVGREPRSAVGHGAIVIVYEWAARHDSDDSLRLFAVGL